MTHRRGKGDILPVVANNSGHLSQAKASREKELRSNAAEALTAQGNRIATKAQVIATNSCGLVEPMICKLLRLTGLQDELHCKEPEDPNPKGCSEAQGDAESSG